MMLGKLAVYARKIHRILVLFITVLGVVMAATGLTMDEAGESGNSLFPFIDYRFARRIHGSLSTYFALVLGLMIATGLYLYLYPWLQKTFRKSPPSSNI
jgi:hypothetical protein